MFQGFACHFELIFGILTIPKCNLSEIEKAMFQELSWHFIIYFLSGFALIAIWVNKRDFYGG